MLLLFLQAFLLQSSGEQLYLAGQFEQARAALSDEVRAGRATPMTYFWLGYTNLALGNKPAAIEPFETYLKSSPRDEDVLYALARTYAQLAEMSLAEIFAIDPKCARAYQMRGIRHELEREWLQAIEQYQTALRLDPKLRGAYSSIARIYERELNDPAKARAAAAREPPHQAREALAGLLKRREAQPRDPNVYFDLGETYTDLKTAVIKRLRGANPSSYRLHQTLAEDYASIHRKDDAIAEYRQVLSAQPELPGVHYELGKLLMESAPEEARGLFERELQIDPNHYLSKSLLGQLLVALREQRKAIPLLEEALAMRPGLLDARKALGRALLDMGEPAKGLPHLETVAKENTDDDQIHFLLAQAYRALGRSEDAAREAARHQQTLRRLAQQ